MRSNQALGNPSLQEMSAPPSSGEPLLNESLISLGTSIAELEMSVNWLIEKIQPVCLQRSAVLAGSCGEKGKAVSEAPSALRAQLIGLKDRVESISALIAPVRYTIEL